MIVLGISCFYHDAAAALVVDGQLVAAAEEERFSRRKHDAGFPTRAIAYCLRQAGITAAELDRVVFYEKPIRKYERILSTSIATVPRSWRFFIDANRTWLGSRLQIREAIAKATGIPAARVEFVEHHASHAASAFFPSPYREAAVLTLDGVGEWACATWGIGSGTKLELSSEQRFPHSLGLLYSAFTAFLGFEVNEGEYKVMGLAAYGTPRYQDEIRRIAHVAGDGSLELDLDYFDFPAGTSPPYGARFRRLFGEPFAPRDENLDSRRADIAASIQRVTEDAIVAAARHVHAATGLESLCMAGGVALNSSANWRLWRESGFRSIWIQPAAGDSGGALGAALLGSYDAPGARRAEMTHAFWGDEPHREEVRIEQLGYRGEELDDDRLAERTADLLAEGAVVGWCRGRFEWGPRALGHRSILADPRRSEMKDVVNARIKFREPFRPFAPSLLRDSAKRYLDLPGELPEAGRFMLMVVPVRDDARAIIPAVTHVDGSCRPQFVDGSTDPVYEGLLRQFAERTGVPVLLNTSFNLRGEPIVATAADALSTFQRCDMDALVIGNTLVRRS